MGQMRASNFPLGLSCVIEEAPSQNTENGVAAAEQRRQHILESMAKLEGHPRETAGLSPPTQRSSRPPNSTKSQHPISQHFESFPCRQSLTGFAPPPQVVPFFCFYPVYPPPLPPTNSHFLERNSMSFNPLLSFGATNLKHLSAPTHSQGTRSQELRTNMQQESLSKAHQIHTNPRHSKLSDVMKTPEKSYRSRSTVLSPGSSPDSFLPTPPPILKYHSSNNGSNQTKYYPKLQFSEAHQQRQQYPDQNNLKKNVNQIQPLDQRSNHSNELRKKIQKNKFENLISSNNYASQLESKKTGIKLIEKKRLTLDEVKVLETLPPLPPRPDPRRSSLLSPSSKKEKKDPFAWFRYFFFSMPARSTGYE